MTKMKSKKMTKSTFVIIIMAIAMVALIAFGGTYAYFTATAKDVTTTGVKSGHIKLSSSGAFIAENSVVLPGDELVGTKITVTPDATGTEGEYVAMKITATFNDAAADADVLKVTLGSGWFYDEATGIYVYGTDASTLTAMTAAQDAVTSIKFNAKENYTQDQAAETTYMDKDIVVKVEFRGIQVKNNTEYNTAAKLAELFTNAVV